MIKNITTAYKRHTYFIFTRMTIIVGIKMNYSALPVFAKTSAIKHLGRLTLSLFFCTLIIGCDGESAAGSYNNTSNDTLNTSVSSNNGDEKQAESITYSNTSVSADKIESINEGESLISAAQPNNPNDSIRPRRAPMISERGADGALQATLIGDYVGILPCEFCTDITVTLNLFSDGSVLKTSIYQNPEKPTLPLIESGIYRQDNTIITVVYDNKAIESYSIQDNHLVMINDDESLNADYTLSRK